MWLSRYPHLSAVLRHRFWTMPVIAVSSVLIGFLEGVGVGLIIPLLSTLTHPPSVPLANPVLAQLERFAAHAGFQDRLLIICGAILCVILVKNLLAAGSKMFSSFLYGRIGHDIRVALSLRLEEAPYAFFQQADSARLLNILTTQSWQVIEAVRASFVCVGSIAVVLVVGALLVMIDWRLALVVAAGALVARALQRTLVNRIKAISRNTAPNDALANRMLFAIFGARVTRLFDQGAMEQARFVSASNGVRAKLVAMDRLSGALWPALEMVHVLLFVTVLLIAVRWGISLPVLAAFLVLLNRMQPHLRTLEQAAGTYAAASGQLAEVDWLLDPENTRAAPDGDVGFTRLVSEIAFDHVGYEYRGASERLPALVDASFSIPKGGAVALIGRSGAGKSTIINLLAGLLEPSSGRILVDGVPLGRLKRGDWLGAIAAAGQDMDLFDGTIAENIAFGCPTADAASIAAAARDAHADFIAALPEGLQTRVGDRGLALSGGQRQRIGIARALIRSPQILILDEATSAVDRLSENAIVDAIRALPEGMTAIVISHRSATLQMCAAGIVLHEGRVVEAGPMETLAEYRAMREREDAGLADAP